MSRPPGPITGPSAWRGGDFRRSDAWIHTFSASELSELHRALARVHARALTLPEIGRDDFPLPTLGPRLQALRYELLHGSDGRARRTPRVICSVTSATSATT